jgi:hypothetical protein
MSTLKDLLRRIHRGEPSPLGFAASTKKAGASMIVVALIGERYAASAGDAAAAGAEALLLTGGPSDKDLADARAAANDNAALGVLAEDASAERISTLHAAGVDFAVVPAAAPAASLQNDDVTFVLQVRDELTDVQLRTIEPLSLRAVYVEQDVGTLTIYRQMELQRISGLARKPLLVRVDAGLTDGDLLTLRESGVALLGIDMKGRGAEGIRDLCERVDKLPRRRVKRDDTEVSLPRASSAAADHEDDEDDDDF